MRHRLLPVVPVLSLLVCAAFVGCAGDTPAPDSVDGAEQLPVDQRMYRIHRAPSPPTVDGRLAEEEWDSTPWTGDFVDIRGAEAPTPRYRTRAKLMWDDRYLYVAAKLEEPDVRADFTTRDTSVWRENALEVFIDPTGDTHNYYEFQINARETQWDLMLTKPYRDGGIAISAWDIRGLKKAVAVQGTLNDPSDTDEGWTVELAMPWSVLEEAAPEGRPPRPGDQWRMNLARVQWPFVVEGGRYKRSTEPMPGHPDGDVRSWVWSPHGTSNIHQPERWGIVQFVGVSAGSEAVAAEERPNRAARWALRRLYYRQQEYYQENGSYAESLSALDTSEISFPDGFKPTLKTTQTMYEITAPGAEGTLLHIRQDGRIWTTAPDSN